MEDPQRNNILLDLHYLKNIRKGFGQYCLNLARNIPSQEIEDLNINYYLPFKWRNSFGKEVGYSTAFDFHRYWGIKKKYDLWHSATHLSKVRPQSNSNTKLVYTIHDVIFSILDRSDAATKEHYKNLQLKINESSGLVYISEFTKKSTQEKFSIPSHVKQYVIYNGTPPLTPLPADGGKNSPFPYLLCIGEFRSYKNQKALIPMMEFLDKGIKLIFIGKCSKEQRRELEPILRKHKVTDRIIFKGNVGEREKTRLLSNAKALLHPSLAEGFGLPVVEAMSLGIPVIISNKTSLPELGGDVATYWNDFEPRNMAEVVRGALENFEKDRIARTRQLKEQAARFSWNKAAKEYVNVYKELLNNTQ